MDGITFEENCRVHNYSSSACKELQREIKYQGFIESTPPQLPFYILILSGIFLITGMVMFIRVKEQG